MARPNPECPPFKNWPGVAAHRVVEQERVQNALPLQGLPRRGFLSSLPADLQSVVLMDTSQLGITLRGLRKLTQTLTEVYGDKFPDMSTADVNMKWVQAVTAERRCRLVEMAELVAPEDVGPPMYFISHTWMNKTARLFDYVLEYLSNASDTVPVWIDILCVNQHGDTVTHKNDVHPDSFSSVVKACTAGTLVVMDTQIVSPATRAWCIFEWAHTLMLHGPDGLHLYLNPKHRSALLGSINVTDAKCFRPEDKVMILGEVTRYHTSPEVFDAKLKLQLLLEPLSYRVDVQRLTQQAAAMGTQWVFDGVDAWLASESRVLCIAAGAGEGKSTISAALWHHWSPKEVRQPAAGSASPVAVCHFLKYSDQRRLDPIRIIKSIAFQLAERIPAVGKQLLLLDVAEVAQMTEVEPAFTKLLLQPLCALTEQQQQPVVLMIDALDEADPQELQLASSSGGKSTCPKACGNLALQLVNNCLCRLPPFVRFIFTTRPDAAAGQVLPCLARTFPDSVMHLPPSALRCMDSSTASSSSSGQQGGVMVYHTAVAACEGIALVPQVLQDPQLEDVYAVYGRVFKAAHALYGSSGHLPGQKKAQLVGELLAVLMAAKEPLAQSFLQQLGLGPAIPLLPGYPKLFFVDEHHIYLMHKSLADWLLDPTISGVFAARVHVGHARIGLYLAGLWRQQQGRQQKPASLGGGSSSTPYLLKYVVTHLAVAADAGAAAVGASGGTNHRSPATAAICAAELDLLLQDLSFLSPALKAGHGPAIIGALGAMRTHTAWSYDVLRWLRSDLRYLAGYSPADIAEQALATVPVNTKIYQLALKAACPTWRARVMLPVEAGDWPACLATMQSSNSAVTAVAFSPGGRQLASGSKDKIIRIWDMATGQCTAMLKDPKGCCDAWSLAFSPDGRQLASGGSGGTSNICSEGHSTLSLWDTVTGQCTTKLLLGRGDIVYSVAFSPDSRQLASGGSDRIVQLWDTTTGQCTATFEDHYKSINSVVFSSDGRHVASGSTDGTVRLWDLATRQCTAKLDHKQIAASSSYAEITSVAFSPDGRQLASGSRDKALRLWDTATGECTATLTGHSGFVGSVSFSPDGRQLASADSGDSKTSTLRLWDVAMGQCTAVLEGHGMAITGLVFSPDGCHLASSSDDRTLRLWDIASAGQRTTSLQPHTDRISCVACSPDGRQVASASWDKTLRLWDTASRGQCSTALEGSDEQVNALAFSPDGRQLASASCGQTRLWNTTTRQCTATLQGPGCYTTSLAFSPNSRQLAFGSDDRTVRLWDTVTGQCTATLEAHGAAVTSLAFSLDGLQVVTRTYDGAVRFWNPATGQCTATIQGGTPYIEQVVFTADGRQLLGCDRDRKMLRYWDTATGQQCATTRLETRTSQGNIMINESVFSPDSRQMATRSGNDTFIRIWDTATGQCTAVLEGHTAYPTSMAFSASGRHFISGCESRILRLWESTTVLRRT